LHSIVAGKADMYKEKKVHLVCVDKPGMGGSAMAWDFSIRKDWPCVIAKVADSLGVREYGVFGVSNGGPYVMACLAHHDDAIRTRCRAAANVVGVSDVSGSGYFSVRHPSCFAEGLYNSLPLFVTGPMIWMGITAGRWYATGSDSRWNSLVSPAFHTPEARLVAAQCLQDASGNAGLGASLDCQQGLSPLYARPGQGPESADEAFRRINVPVALWYGEKDSTVPMKTAHWLAERIKNRTLHFIPDGTHMSTACNNGEAILDDLLTKMDAPRVV